jgi:branched-subunit amino acid transport protein
MSWTTLLVIAAGAYAFKALGLIVLGGREFPPRVLRCLDLLPAALLPALITANTLVSNRSIVIDARLPGVAVAAFLTWKKAPFPVILIAAAAVTAGIRSL